MSVPHNKPYPDRNMSDISIESFVTDQLIRLYDKEQLPLKLDIKRLYQAGFPNMPETELSWFISDFFKPGVEHYQRKGFFFRDQTGQLAAAVIFSLIQIPSAHKPMTGLYLISRAVAPLYQGFGLGKIIAKTVLTQVKPDIFFTTCTQSSSLHSWLRLIQTGTISAYEAFPRLEMVNGQDMLITVSERDMDVVVTAFRQCYLTIVDGDTAQTQAALENLTRLMVRKNMYVQRYDFDPWHKHGRVDKLAQALGVTNKDGVLLVLLKQPKIYGEGE